MINTHRVHTFIEGEKFSFDGSAPLKPQKEIPNDAILAFITRLVKELLSPNSVSTHECEDGCRQIHAIIIGQTNTRGDAPEFEKAVPRYSS